MKVDKSYMWAFIITIMLLVKVRLIRYLKTVSNGIRGQLVEVSGMLRKYLSLDQVNILSDTIIRLKKM
ncbi:hypothetical protein VC88_12450 [Geobacillus sp. A8]|nr:hypothetical protein VC88_12450 [Geobacillus sp. A8]